MTIEAFTILFAILLVSCAARFVPVPTIRQLVLLGASYFIYSQWAGKRFLLVLIASSLLNYFWGSVLRRRPTVALLWTGVGLNVLLLVFFKYLSPLANELPGLFEESDLVHWVI